MCVSLYGSEKVKQKGKSKVVRGRNNDTQVYNPFHKQMHSEILTLTEAEVTCDAGEWTPHASPVS